MKEAVEMEERQEERQAWWITWWSGGSDILGLRVEAD